MLPETDGTDWGEFEGIFARVREQFMQSPKIALMGFGKAGKSSLFNAIYGERRARVSMRTDETTSLQTEVSEGLGLELTDTPGFGTQMFGVEDLAGKGFFEEQHVIIHVL